MSAPPTMQATTPTWRVIVAFGVVLALAAALIVVSRSQPAQEAIVDRTPAAATTSPPPPSAIAAPDTGDRLLDDTAAALAAWGVFAATGDLDAVSAAFAEGPQLDQLRAEAAERAANGPGLPAFTFTLAGSKVVDVTPDRAVVRSTVEMRRVGTEPADFHWDIDMRWDEATQRWLLYTVSSVDG